MRSSLHPVARWVLLYAVVELAAAALLIWALGLGWALVVMAVVFAAGVLLSASQVKGAFRTRRSPQAALADGVIVAAGSFLVFLPGVVSTAAGALMLAPPTRSAMRPAAQAMLTRGLVRRVNVDYLAPRRRDYIDGEVIDGEIATPNLPAVR